MWVELVKYIFDMRERVPVPEPVVETQDWNILVEADRLLKSSKTTPPPVPTEVYRSSSLSKMCPREEVLRHMHGISKLESIDSKLQRIFDFGNAFNDLAQNRYFGEWGWLIGDWVCNHCHKVYTHQKKPSSCPECAWSRFTYIELFFENKEAGISGHPDGILEMHGSKKLVELKTCNSDVYKFVTEINRSPLDFHVDQISLYMWHYNLLNGSIIYLNKDTADWVQFPQVFNLHRVERLLRNVKLAREGMLNRKVPERTVCSNQDCARAKRCTVRKLCFEKT